MILERDLWMGIKSNLSYSPRDDEYKLTMLRDIFDPILTEISFGQKKNQE